MLEKFIVNKSVLISNNDYMTNKKDELLYSKQKEEIQSSIFQAVNGEISAKNLTDKLFPEKKPHVFISHSSKDVSEAIQLANTLHEKYDVISFIDSQLWEHIDYAIKKMHDMYCKIPNSSSYYYHKSNNLLSHMHAILSMALMRVMDNADCVMFIESENSIYKYMEGEKINPRNIIEDKLETLSPWISSEVNFANNLRKKGHIDRGHPALEENAGMESRDMMKGYHLGDSMPKITHELDFTNFIEVTNDNFRASMRLSKSTPINYLDNMYGIYHQG